MSDDSNAKAHTHTHTKFKKLNKTDKKIKRRNNSTD